MYRITSVLAGCLLAAASPALADSIDFAQFGPPGTTITNGASGVTNGGISFTISGTGSGFTEYIEDYAHAEPNSWAGEFAYHETILFNNSAASPVTLTFASAISSIQNVQAQANAGGAYTASLFAYSGLTLLGSDSYDSYNDPGNPAVEGTIPNLDFFGAGITSVQLFTTNDSDGFALGGTGGVNNPPPPSSDVPEPASWAMMLAGFGAIGGAMRSRRKAAVSFG